MGQESALAYLRHGQTPFFRLPLAETPWAGAQAVILGVPYDGSTTSQPGTRLAPYHVRRASALVQSRHPVHGIDVFGRRPTVDGGNVVFPPFDAASTRAAIEAEVACVLKAGAAPFLVGGDHSIALPSLRAVAKKHGPVTVVHVDARLDASGPEVWGEAYHHCAPLRHAVDEGLIATGQLFQVGIRAARGEGDEAVLDRALARRWSADEVAEDGVDAIALAIQRAAGGRPLYLSFDIAAVDPAFAPGTGTPVPGGITAREALAFLRALAGVRLVGMDLVEVCPPLDLGDSTAHLAAHLLYEGLALLSLGESTAA